MTKNFQTFVMVAAVVVVVLLFLTTLGHCQVTTVVPTPPPTPHATPTILCAFPSNHWIVGRKFKYLTYDAMTGVDKDGCPTAIVHMNLKDGATAVVTIPIRMGK